MADTRPPVLLVTGASGFLGQQLVRQAVASGRYDRIWATWFSHPENCQIPGVDPVRLDITDQTAVLQLATEIRPDIVIHTAYSKQEPFTYAVTAIGTRHVARAVARIGGRLIHMSSDVVFDGERAPYDEAAVPYPVHAYGRAKAAAEATVRALLPAATIVRTSLIVGLDPLDRISAWVVNSLRNGRPITLFTDEWRNPVWVHDLAAAVLELAQRTRPFVGPIHVAGPQALTRYQMGVRLARFFGLDAAGITPGLSRESGMVRPRDLRLDISLARHLLCTRLRGFDEGLADYAQDTRPPMNKT